MSMIVSRAVAATSALVLLLLLPAEGTAQSLAIDRWLVSDAFLADTIADPLLRDHLAGGGESFILPDRGAELGGTPWNLLREDGATLFVLPATGEGRSVVYANAYLRSPADQTVRVQWTVSSCARMALLLNGQRVEPDDLLGGSEGELRVASAWVRLGFGWNTILAKVDTDCLASFGVLLEDGLPEDGVPPWPEAVSLQASRPPGDIRLRPSPWVVLSPAIGPLAGLDWHLSHLTGALRLRFTGWGVGTPGTVQVKARVEGEQAEYVLDPGLPSAPADTVLTVAFPRLRKAGTRRGAARIELRWPDEKLEMELDVPASSVLEAFHGPIHLLGWGPGPDDPGPDGEDGDMPSASRVLRGSWVIPDALDGFSLQIDVRDSPGEYRLQLAPLSVASGTASLCAPCRKGTPVDLFVTVTEDWTGWPFARVIDPGYSGSGDAAEAAGWLQMLDDRGSNRYRARGLETSGP